MNEEKPESKERVKKLGKTKGILARKLKKFPGRIQKWKGLGFGREREEQCWFVEGKNRVEDCDVY